MILRDLLKSSVIRLKPNLRRESTTTIPNSASSALKVFNRHVKFLQKERAAIHKEKSRQVDYLKDEVAMRLVGRLLDIKRQFTHVLDFGANSCNIARALINEDSVKISAQNSASSKILHLTSAESSGSMLYRDDDLPSNKNIKHDREIIDEECLPYRPNTFDAVLSSLSMHWINDLPSVLRQINRILKPDTPLIAAMFGGDTLYELRTSLQLADQERRGGVSPHVSPFADIRDVGRLLHNAGFKMLTIDLDDIIVGFPDIFSLMQDLQAMGENNAVLGRELGAIHRDVLLASEGIYRELYGCKDGTISATFRVIHMIGWKEGPNQKQPLPRGTGKLDIRDVLSEMDKQL